MPNHRTLAFATLLFGALLAASSAPIALDEKVTNTQCRQSTQVDPSGQVACSNRICKDDTESVDLCEPQDYDLMGGGELRMCNCGPIPVVDDPTEDGICHAYGYTNSSGQSGRSCMPDQGCAGEEICDWENGDLYYQTCSCK